MDFDIVVVGASSSGLYAAAQLVRAGQRVAVFERQHELVPARRTYIITPQLRQVLGYIPDTALLHHIHVMAVETPHARVQIDLKDPDLIVERSQLIRHLAESAREAGVEFHFGYRFQGAEAAGDGVRLQVHADGGRTFDITARSIMGADGVFSDVAVAAGLERPPSAPLLQAEVELPPDWDPAVTKTWFDVEETRFFYWLIPESTERGVVGLVADSRSDIRGLLQRFMERHGFRPLAFQAGQVAMHHPRLRPWGRIGQAPVYLVGDAAGQVKVTTVGGTVTGFWGAQAAVRALLNGAPYARELRALKRELDLHWLLRWMLDRMDNAAYDRLVRTITPAVQGFLGRYNRDEMARVAWKLPLIQPRFFLVGFQALLQPSSGERAAPAPVTSES